eukprot:530983-Pyramimonas_sp.AAC.1
MVSSYWAPTPMCAMVAPLITGASGFTEDIDHQVTKAWVCYMNYSGLVSLSHTHTQVDVDIIGVPSQEISYTRSDTRFEWSGA